MYGFYSISYWITSLISWVDGLANISTPASDSKKTHNAMKPKYHNRKKKIKKNKI
jgi:hypothetical protein